MTLYDRIGSGYGRTRTADPRIAAAIDLALGDATTVVNVGAGTGSYEPTGRDVTAVEPSQEMIDQRPPGSAPAVRAAAESLPFPDGAFDAAMACMTVHHWDDLAAGLAELRRVASARIVVFTWDPEIAARSWLTSDYLPELHALDVFRFAPPASIGEALGLATTEVIPIPADCQDGFIEAWWARPEAYLDPVVRDGCSGFRALDPQVVERATTKLQADLDSGEWDRRHGELRALAEMDMGYRLVSAEREPAA